MRWPHARDLLHIGQAVATRQVPVYVHYGITHRCNLTCKMCGIWRYGNRAEELSLDQIRQFAALLRKLGVFQLAIGGGEPFQRDDLEEVVAIFLQAGLNLRVLTNGVGIAPQRLERMVASGLRDFSISLDSLYPARFDYICEHEGSWEAAVRTMTTIAALLKGKRALPVINCVVSHLNLEELVDIAHFARELGFAISFLPVELLEDPRDGRGNWEARFVRFQPDMRLPLDPQAAGRVAERVDRAYDGILRLKHKGFPVLNSTPFLEACRQYLKTGRFPAEACDAGRLYFSVAPGGQFTICHRAMHQHPSILDPGFEDYLKSEAYEQLRRHEAASCEGCMRACWIDTSFMFRTLQGLLEMGGVQALPRKRAPMTWEQARTWARYDLDAVVPGTGPTP